MSELAGWVADGGVLVALRRRRRLRAGLAQGGMALVGLVLGLAAPAVTSGPQLDTSSVQPLLVALSGGLVSFIALVFSLLFLVVQYGSTTFTPRLTLFRDDPIVWRTFGMFVAIFIFIATAGLRLGGLDDVTLLVPALAVALVVVALLMARRLQMAALGHVQLNATLHEVRARGEAILRQLYDIAPARCRDEPLPPVTQTVEWDGPFAVLRQVDLPELHAQAVAAGAVIRLHVPVGDELRRRAVVLTVHGAAARLDEARLRGALEAGIDRTFDQDPLLAFRLLDDIGVRALSSAVNDPATAAAAIAHVHDLLGLVAERNLDIGRVPDAHGSLRVEVPMPDWEAFLVAALDDLVHYGRHVPLARRRLLALVDDLLDLVPPARVDALERRRQSLVDTHTHTHTTGITATVGGPS